MGAMHEVAHEFTGIATRHGVAVVKEDTDGRRHIFMGQHQIGLIDKLGDINNVDSRVVAHQSELANVSDRMSIMETLIFDAHRVLCA